MAKDLGQELLSLRKVIVGRALGELTLEMRAALELHDPHVAYQRLTGLLEVQEGDKKVERPNRPGQMPPRSGPSDDRSPPPRPRRPGHPFPRNRKTVSLPSGAPVNTTPHGPAIATWTRRALWAVLVIELLLLASAAVRTFAL